MTPQQIYNKVAKHLLTQNAKSQDETGGCLYRGPNGLKCAVGPLIPDELYRPSMEGEPVRNLCDEFDWFRDQFGEHKALLTRLQHIHDDDCNPVSDWPALLHTVAVEFDLKPVV